MFLGWLLSVASVAHAAERSEAGIAPVVGASAGWALPAQRDTVSEPGPTVGAHLGLRAGFGPVHLRPELVVRVDGPSDALSAAAGGAVTLGGPVAVGGYAHVGPGTHFDRTFVHADAGAMLEVGVKPVLLAVTLGWARSPAAPLQAQCIVPDGCEIPTSDHWFVPGLLVAFAP